MSEVGIVSTYVRYSVSMETVGRWWNGTWGRLARRDVYLRIGTVSEVEAREGGAEGRSRTWQFETRRRLVPSSGNAFNHRAIGATSRTSADVGSA